MRDWFADLNLARDIDVLWMGTRRTRRRSNLLDQVRGRLATHGISMYVADNVENPFIYGEERTRFLNRAKITLNLLPTWYDHAFPYRFHIAAPNRSLVVSEPVLAHSSMYKAGSHYVSSPPKQIADAILHYLDHEAERMSIVENAYRLVTAEMTFGSSIRAILEHVTALHQAR